VSYGNCLIKPVPRTLDNYIRQMQSRG